MAHRRGFSLLELAISLGIIVVLLAVLLPALGSARAASHLETCAGHQRHLGVVWHVCLEDRGGQFPDVPLRPGWRFGGVRFSPIDGRPVLDYQRPLNAYVIGRTDGAPADLFRCPADNGVTDALGAAGTGRRTAWRSFGTSFRANDALLNARVAGLDERPRGLFRHEITASPSRLVLMGDPIWHEIVRRTERDARWHVKPDAGNLLFLDGSVRFQALKPGTTNQPVLVDPVWE